jgi:hypothetical protein
MQVTRGIARPQDWYTLRNWLVALRVIVLMDSTTNIEGAGIDFHEVSHIFDWLNPVHRPGPGQSPALLQNLLSLFGKTDIQFHLTENSTALYTVYNAEEYDLSSYNLTTEDGSQGWILNNYVQEIDIESGTSPFRLVPLQIV